MLEEELNRKKKVRVAQHAMVTKMIIQVKELCHKTNSDTPQLAHVQRILLLLAKG